VGGVEVPESAVEGELARARERYASNPRLLRYLESARGRAFVRSNLRRSLVVEHLIDAWLAAHPDHRPLPHLEDDRDEPARPGSDGADPQETRELNLAAEAHPAETHLPEAHPAETSPELVAPAAADPAD